MNYLFVLLTALLLAALGFAGLVLFRRRRQKKAEESLEEKMSSVPYETAAIDQYLYDRCCRYMVEHRPFLVHAFTLQDLANAVYTNKSYLSKTINRFSGKNFRQYVNYYRIMYAMDLYRKNMGLRVRELSELSGFHSQTAFLRCFKYVMGEQPSVWCARMRKKYSNQV